MSQICKVINFSHLSEDKLHDSDFIWPFLRPYMGVHPG